MIEIFDARPALIGVVHLLATPGAPRFAGPFERVVARATEDARCLCANGCDALIVENFGDAPFYPDRVPSETIASISVCVREVVGLVGSIPVGVNVLRNDARAALGIASATGARFVRVNVHTGAAITDQGLIEGRAHESLRERARLAPSVLILADAHVKHATPLGRESLSECVSDLVQRGLCDAVIVSGAATGHAPRLEDVREAREAAGVTRMFLGSGVNADNAPLLLAHADGAIVGTALKKDGRIENAVDAARVARLRRIFDSLKR